MKLNQAIAFIIITIILFSCGTTLFNADVAKAEDEVSTNITQEQYTYIYKAILDGVKNHEICIDFCEEERDSILSTPENQKMILKIARDASVHNAGVVLMYPYHFQCLQIQNNENGELYINGILVYYLSDYTKHENSYNEAISALQEIVNGIPDSSTTFEKIYYVHDYMIENYKYDYSIEIGEFSQRAFEAHSAYGLLVNKKGVCDGFSSLFTLLMNEYGIPCHNVISREDNHEWNIVCVNGEWLYADVTWDCAHSFYGTTWDRLLLTKEQMREKGYLTDDWVLEDGSSPDELVSAQKTHLPGDINNDGILNSLDVLLLQKYLNCDRSFTKEEKQNADVYQDNVIDIYDLGLLRYIIINS